MVLSTMTDIERENSTEGLVSPQPLGNKADGGNGVANWNAHEAAVVVRDMREDRPCA